MFANPKKTAALILGEPEDPVSSDHMGDHDEDMHGLAQDLIHAVHSKDPVAVADAFRAMFLALESEPHDEAPEEEEEPGMD